MMLKIQPKDTTKPLLLDDVAYYCEQVNTLLVVFNDGVERNYPFIHIWYYEDMCIDYNEEDES